MLIFLVAQVCRSLCYSVDYILAQISTRFVIPRPICFFHSIRSARVAIQFSRPICSLAFVVHFARSIFSLNLLPNFVIQSFNCIPCFVMQSSRSILLTRFCHSFFSLNLLAHFVIHFFLVQFARSFSSCIYFMFMPSLLYFPVRGMGPTNNDIPPLHPGVRCAATTGDSGRLLRCSPSRPSSTRTPSCSLELCASSARGRTTPGPGTVWRWPLPRRRRGRWRARPSAWWVVP